MPIHQALDLLNDILTEWLSLFQRVPPFMALVRDAVVPALRPLLRGLQVGSFVLPLVSKGNRPPAIWYWLGLLVIDLLQVT